MAEVGTPDAAQLDAAIESARRAQREWAATPAAERAEALHEVAARMRARTDELAELMTREGGKPLVENRDEVGWTASAFDFYAELARTAEGRVIPPVESSQLALVLKEPLGLVTCIVPWNYPLLLLAWKLAPVLAAGNAALCKPSELTPLSTLALAPCVDHLPAGLVALLAGGGDVGERLVDDERVDGIAFTGSVATGTRIAERAAAPGRARQPRARRQGPVHRLRRRGGRDRDRRPRRRLGRVPQRRPGLHVGRALLRPARGLRRLPRRVRRPHAHAHRRRPDGSQDRHRPDGQRRPARQGPRAGRARRRGGRPGARRRRRRGPRPRPLLRPHGGHRRARGDRPPARGDLRPGRADRPGHAASTRRSSWPTPRPTASAPTSTRASSRPRSAAPASCAPAPSGSTTR